MIPEEIYASSGSSSQTFKYAHPLSREPVNDSSMRSRIAYDLMTFMQRSDCPYFLDPERLAGHSHDGSEDEIDIMIIDGYYKESLQLINEKLAADEDDEKALFQKAFIEHLQREYQNLLVREERVLERDPHDVNALINKGFALANLGEEEEALNTCKKALIWDPENITALTNTAHIAKNMGDEEQHDKALGKAFEVARKRRIEALQAREAALLEDFGSKFMNDGRMPSPHTDFDKSRGTLH